jgi:hypothetical protein
MIDEYLERLDRELRARRAPRRRFLAEAEDHLRSAAQELGSEREAVERFGDATLVARRFAETAAATSARRSAGILLFTLAAYVSAAGAFAATAGPEFADFPQGAPTQLALVTVAAALAAGLLRSRLRVRAMAVSAAALGGGAGLELAAALTRPAGILPWHTLPLVSALFAVAAVGSALAAVSTAVTAVRTTKLRRTS